MWRRILTFEVVVAFAVVAPLTLMFGLGGKLIRYL